MDRVLCLHIGLPKTGSSAIQNYLLSRAAQLSEAGFHYALAPGAEADSNGVSSGNGGPLVHYLDPRRRPPGFDLAAFEDRFDETYLADGRRTSIVSSEFLASAGAPELLRFRDVVLRDRPVTVVAVIRNLYDHAFSSWSQLVKRHAYRRSFAHFADRQYVNSQLRALRVYGKCFGWETLRLVDHDGHRRDVVRPFLEAIGAPAPEGWRSQVINRSLSRAELEVQCALNRLHGSQALAAAISDRFVASRPDAQGARVWRPDLGRMLIERHREEVRAFADKTGLPVEGLLDVRPRPESWATPFERFQAAWDALSVLCAAGRSARSDGHVVDEPGAAEPDGREQAARSVDGTGTQAA